MKKVQEQIYNFVKFVYNRQMSNTFEIDPLDYAISTSKQSQRAIKIGSISTLIAVITTLAMLISQCQCRDTVLLASLSTKTDQILFRMLKQTNYLFKSNRIINGKELTCYSIAKNELTVNNPQKSVLLNYSISHKTAIDNAQSISQHSVQYLNLCKKLDSILNIMNGVCLYYRTTTFISQYCHKEHFRQFDDDYTKYYNQKQKYQDFYLGFYTPISESRSKLRHSDGTVPPLKSNFAGIHTTPSVSDTLNITNNIEMQENANGRLVHSSTHMVTSESYITKLPVFLQVKCNSFVQSKKKVVNNVVITVTPFDFVYTKKQGSCDQFISAVEIFTPATYQQQQKLRVYEQFLFGDVEQICTQNWMWQGHNKHYEDSQLKSGSTLYLQYIAFVNNQNILLEQLVIVKHVHNYQLVQLQQKLGISFNTKELNTIISKNKKYLNIQKITKCQILFDRPLVTSKKYQQNLYLGNNLAILDEGLSEKNQQTRNLGCICALKKHGTTHLIDMKIATDNPIWLNYYRIYMQTKTFIYQYNYFKDTVFTQCYNIDCYPFKQSYDASQLPKSKFTQMIKISLSNQVYNVTQATKHHIYVVSVHQSGTIRLVTKDSKGNIYFYILSEGQLIKIRQFENGTKEIIKQNKYYENMTKISNENFQNYIFIHCFLLSNGTKYGAIWKFRDYMYFPRFVLADQQLVSFQYRFGYAYVRKINPQKLKNKQALVILNFQKLIQKHHVSTEQQDNHKDAIFLDKSYSINYTYEGGDFCGPPINKKRTTLVTLKCGKAWFKIQKVHQTAPCSYFVQIQTLYLCKENTKEVVESDEELGDKTDEDKVSFSGVTCLKEQGIYNRIAPITYPGKQLLG